MTNETRGRDRERTRPFTSLVGRIGAIDYLSDNIQRYRDGQQAHIRTPLCLQALVDNDRDECTV